jgi:hypothetical protein
MTLNYSTNQIIKFFAILVIILLETIELNSIYGKRLSKQSAPDPNIELPKPDPN